MVCMPITQILSLFNYQLGYMSEHLPELYNEVRMDCILNPIDDKLNDLTDEKTGKLWLT